MADHIILVENPTEWKPHFPKLPVVAAKDYLAKPEYSTGRSLRVLNLCRSYRYLSVGYYCSLLAEARRHRVIPSVRTLNDLSRKSIYSLDVEDLTTMSSRCWASPDPASPPRPSNWISSSASVPPRNYRNWPGNCSTPSAHRCCAWNSDCKASGESPPSRHCTCIRCRPNRRRCFSGAGGLSQPALAAATGPQQQLPL